jgi:hypothetical protein
MWGPQHLTTPWASTACYRDTFTYYVSGRTPWKGGGQPNANTRKFIHTYMPRLGFEPMIEPAKTFRGVDCIGTEITPCFVRTTNYGARRYAWKSCKRPIETARALVLYHSGFKQSQWVISGDHFHLLLHNYAARTTPVVSATSTHTHTLRLCCVIFLFVFVSTLALFYCRSHVWFSSPKFHGHIQLSQTGGRKLVNV